MPLDVWGAAPGPCQGLCPWTPLGAPPPNPRPLLKKAGENQLEYFFGFPAKYAGPPLMGSGGLVLFVGSRGRKGVADDSFGRQKTATARGGRRRLAARGPRPPGLPNKKAGAGGKASPLLFRALRAPPPPPGGTPTPSPYPTPAHLRWAYGGCSWEAGGWDGPGGAFPQRQKAAKKEAVKPPPRSVVFNMGP